MPQSHFQGAMQSWCTIYLTSSMCLAMNQCFKYSVSFTSQNNILRVVAIQYDSIHTNVAKWFTNMYVSDQVAESDFYCKLMWLQWMFEFLSILGWVLSWIHYYKAHFLQNTTGSNESVITTLIPKCLTSSKKHQYIIK